MGATRARPVKKRHPALAAFLSLLMPGLGQIYNQMLVRGLAILAVFVGGLVLLLLLQLAPSINPALAAAHKALVPFLLLLFLATIVDAFLGARSVGTVSLARYNRASIYLAGIVIWAATAAFLDPEDSYSIPSGSLLPTLAIGDRLVAWNRYYSTHEPRYGDLTIFRRPPTDDTDFIMRIVGLPGDRIQIIAGVLRINGEPVQRERVEDRVIRDGRGRVRPVTQYLETLPNGRSYSIIEVNGDTGPLDNTGIYVVPSRHYFAMGDNRDNSADSRGNGRNGWFVPSKNLVGYPIYIFWSRDWRRVGSRVQPLP